ncbi:Uncharacterised protein [Kingella denitrificans]|uniref:Uncharacterized protein n=1 Tax=Kingella denitrificans ATCC 33394 TaxID=888741 RepID=F0F200_9NEIS|nr:hypothetical protein [Kingella denitrificans]EGC16541.1 hypothetical protein HMPREF9098_2135 [Kingella denitrificans ATCC 33394]QQB42534.1 hypothetical protein I6I17_03035 [Kingella denitrificans]STR11526.1 Uncharacterised protein [Kingella denitrificans]
MQETAKLFGLAFGVLFLCALIGGIGTTLLLHTSFSGTFLRTLYLGFFGALPVAVFQGRAVLDVQWGKYLALFGVIGGVLSVLVFGYIAVYLDVHLGWKMGFLEEAVLLMVLPFGVNAWKLAQKK